MNQSSLTEAKIQLILATKFMKQGCVCVPNCGAFGWEADLLRLTRSLSCVEYEIKITKADFRADAQKRWKHQLLSQPRKAREDRSFVPNYFWYCAPAGVIPAVELPAYAGLLEVADDGSLYPLKSAPRLHRGVLGFREAAFLLRGINFRFWEMRGAELQPTKTA